ncbi:hypothetical protein WN50_31240 [Limnoraphis robusta CS-951]|uniref:Uncharacterized protein n=1 Tax=Limnoraphis robusta CS-951 TaxID=1637645 RepID=A0A0J9F0J4_9CYAN|nr:hypothetical protein WN50_31240 [Limnoraphis robusta CS-951]
MTNPVIRKLPIFVEFDDKGIKGGGINVGIGSISVDRDKNLGISVGIPGIADAGVKINDEGGGEVSLPGGIKIVFKKEGCFTVETRTIFGQYAGSNITKDPSCNSNDDDDSGGGSDEPKPPHCIGSDGKRGTGPPKNLLPECADDGKVHTFLWIRNDQFSHSSYGDIYNYDTGLYERGSRTVESFAGTESFDCTALMYYSDSTEIRLNKTNRIYNPPVAISPNSFVGTFAEFKAQIVTYPQFWEWKNEINNEDGTVLLGQYRNSFK